MKKNVVLIVEREYHFRNYLTGLVDFTSDSNFDYTLILPKEFSTKPEPKYLNQRHHFVEFGKRHQKLFLLMREINMFSNIRKSSSFRYSLMRSYPPFSSLVKNKVESLLKKKETSSIVNKRDLQTVTFKFLETSLKSMWSLVFFLVRRIRLLFIRIASTLMRNDDMMRIISELIRERKLTKKLEEIKPDIVLYVTSLHEYSSIPIARFCKKNRITYILVPDNWDNLSSKRTLWERPDYVGVWGRQGIHHLEKIHGYQPNQSLYIGSPRMIPLLQTSHSSLSRGEIKTILFVGAAVPFNELRAIETILQNAHGFKEKIKLIYRPYPWREHQIPREVLKAENFEIDSSIAKLIEEKQVTDFSPQFEDYVKLLQNSDLVVGGLTTMLLEAAIIGKKVIALIHNDFNRSVDSPHLGYQYFEHFRGLEKFPNLKFCSDLGALWELITLRLMENLELPKSQFEDARNWFYNVKDNKNFIANLNANLDFVSKVH